MLRKLKWQIPEEPLAGRYNWCQGPVSGRGPAVEKHWSTVHLLSKCFPLWSCCVGCWRMRLVGNTARIGEGEINTWFEKPKANRKIGKTKSICENNIKKDLTEIVYGAWTGLIWPRIPILSHINPFHALSACCEGGYELLGSTRHKEFLD